MNTFFEYRFALRRDVSSRDILLVFNATSRFDSAAFATLVEGEIEANLVPDELLLVVRGAMFAETRSQLESESLNLATLARLRNRCSVTLLGYDERGYETMRAAIVGPTPQALTTFGDFKRRAITHIFRSRRGFVESTSTYHFQNPSGRHTKRFIRLSNVLARGSEIAFIGFCALPFIPEGADIAYVDTPSLYAVVSAINDQRSGMSGVTPLIADNFGSYAGAGRYYFNQIERSFVLISASSSGSLASALMRDEGFTPEQVIHILLLGADSSKSQIVCDLKKDGLNPDGFEQDVEQANGCSMCASGSYPIKLQGDQFEFAGPQQSPILIAKGDAPQILSGFVSRIVGGDILQVGLGQSSDRQPRQFNINVARLLAHTPFRERLGYVLRQVVPASVTHIIALDRESNLFANQILLRVPTATVITRDDLDDLHGVNDLSVMVVAAVIESGRSFLDLSRDLRTAAPDAPISYLVGVSKTTGNQLRESLKDTLSQTKNARPYQLIEVERVVLPISDENNSWSAERRLLRHPDTSALIPPELTEFVEARIERLLKASEPLRDELFLANAPDRKLRLQPGFVFWPTDLPSQPHSQADVYYTIASVLQQLRANSQTAKERAIKSNWFQQTILAAGNFGRYNDDIIQASLLRSATPFEMNFADAPMESHELLRMLENVIESADKDRGGAATEFLLAIATKRLQLTEPDTQMLLKHKPVGVAMVDFLLELCKKHVV